MLGNILEMFKRTSKNADYQDWITAKIYRLVGEALFDLKKFQHKYWDKIYQKMIRNSKNEMFFIL